MIDFLVHQMMLPVLQFFHGLTQSWGWSIVLLTVTIKMALMPLTVQQFRSMRAMQTLQPRLQELQKRYKNKPEELNKKVLALYQENKVNPFGGCLPLLVQMPFLFALYATLIGDDFKKLSADSSFYMIGNLSVTGFQSPELGVHWGVVALIVLFGVTTFLSQKMMMTNANDPMQRQMLYLMPVMITATFVVVPIPAGVLLYMVVSNLITIAQNAWMLKAAPAGMAPAKAHPPETTPSPAPIEKTEEDAEVDEVTETSAETATLHPSQQAKARRRHKKKKRKGA